MFPAGDKSCFLPPRGGYTVDILILTGKFGMGHWSAAQALSERLEERGHRTRVVDLFDYALPKLAPAMYRGFDFLVTYWGGIYNLVHHMTRNAEGEPPIAARLTRRLDGLLADARPELVLSTHPVCSGAVALYKRKRGSRLPLVTCITDVTCHSEWLHTGTDGYLVPSAAVREGLVAKGVRPERIVVMGVPVDSRFDPGQRRQEGPRQLLIMGGGLGLMPRQDSFYEALNALPDVHTTILTGRNEKLYRRLRGKYGNVEVVSFTREVPYYMGRAHLMLSKPGGVTTFEAIAARLPLLAWEPFLEQERENARFLVSHGMARIVAKEESACLEAIRSAIYDDKLLAGMERAMDELAGSLSQGPVCWAEELCFHTLRGVCA